ncbi:MAG TPA: MMPL family transporter [Actinomycetota bacterium]|nr:MMPL family transporter [Actinomycetota bacterium]
MSWQRVASFVLRHPGRTLALALAILVPPTLALPNMRTTFDVLSELPASTDSVQGFQALRGSFGPGQVQPVFVVVRLDSKVWNDDAFEAIDELTVTLEKVPGVADVRSITRPTGGRVPPQQLEALGLGGLTELAEGLPRATRGLERATSGLRRIRDGLEQIRAGIPGQEAGIEQALQGIEAMRDGVDRIRAGMGRIAAGLERAEAGLRRLAERVAEPTLRALRAAWDDLRDATLAKLDPQYPQLARHVGEALALVSGRCPDAEGIGPQPADCPAGRKIDPRYDGLAPTLRGVAEGLDRAADGVRKIDLGMGGLDQGLAQLESGMAESAPQLDQLESGTSLMIGGLDRIIPGLERLRRGLAMGASLVEQAGLIPQPGDEVALTATLVEAFPKLREQLGFFVGDGGRATRLFLFLEDQPYRESSLEASRQIREISQLALRETALEDAELLVTGSAPFFSDVADTAGGDFGTIIWAVILGILLVFILLLRSLIAPVYLMGTVLLSFASTLGLTVIVFQGLFGEIGLVWWLPAFLFVILVALGADYNIFLTGRIREEAGEVDTRSAVGLGLSATGRVITSAGLILAGTFAALLAAPIQGMVEMGFAASVGLLVDTFVVRTLLVPSIAVLLGSANWWPSRRAARP